jgi:hypothetical protein
MLPDGIRVCQRPHISVGDYGRPAIGRRRSHLPREPDSVEVYRVSIRGLVSRSTVHRDDRGAGVDGGLDELFRQPDPQEEIP